MAKTTPLYIGDKEIKVLKKGVVTFVDGSQETYTEKQISYLITKEPKDLTQLRDIVLDNIIPEIMDIFEAHNIKKWDLGSILQWVTDTYNFAFLEAIGKAFGTYEEKTHPSYFQENIRVSDIKRIAGK